MSAVAGRNNRHRTVVVDPGLGVVRVPGKGKKKKRNASQLSQTATEREKRKGFGFAQNDQIVLHTVLVSL
jgi:hypothetical protein